MRIDIVSIFPEYLAPLDLSLIGTARREGLLDVEVHDLRAFAHDRHRTVDDAPAGGGAGMVMTPQPWGEALAHVSRQSPGRPRLLVPAPSGQPLTQALARELAQEPWLVFACGRYEGIDERVFEHAREDLGLTVSLVSLGDYVLNGGEVAALAIIEAAVRLIPGVIGNEESLIEESHEDGLLEYPLYTKPARWDTGTSVREVPPILLSGNHAAIAAWRHTQRVARTAARRPDLLHGSHLAGKLSELDVTLAVPADAAELMVLQRACWLPEVHAASGRWAGPMESLPEIVESFTQWRTVTVRAHGRLVGSVRGRVRPTDERVWETGRLMVAPDLQGRGLGRELLALSEQSAPDTVRTYWLNTGAASTRNQRIYRRAGYRLLPGEGAHPGTVDLVKRR